MARPQAIQASIPRVFAPPAWRAAGPRAKEFPVNSRPETKYLLAELLACGGFDCGSHPVGLAPLGDLGGSRDEAANLLGAQEREAFRCLGVRRLRRSSFPRLAHAAGFTIGENSTQEPVEFGCAFDYKRNSSPGLKGVGANTTGSRGLCDRSNNAPVLSPPFMGAGGRCPLKGGAGCSTVEGSGPRSVPAWSGSQKRRRPRRMPVQRGPEVHPETPLRRIP
jgi:hypothetical protein